MLSDRDQGTFKSSILRRVIRFQTDVDTNDAESTADADLDENWIEHNRYVMLKTREKENLRGGEG